MGCSEKLRHLPKATELVVGQDWTGSHVAPNVLLTTVGSFFHKAEMRQGASEAPGLQ